MFFTSHLNPKTFVGVCNGLVCLMDDGKYGDAIYLVNPFIRKYRKLYTKSSCYANLIGEMEGEFGRRIRIAFGYSEIEDDYKVLRIITPDYYQERNTSLKTEHIAEIYSLKTGEWKSVDVSINFELEIFNSATCVHGCLYWCMGQKEGKKAYLLCFDLKDKVFSKIELPETFHKLSGSRYRHNTFKKNNSLVVVLYDDPFANATSSKTNICLLEKNLDGHEVQWRELSYKCSRSAFYSRDPDFGGYRRKLNALGFSVGGKLIFEVYPDLQLDDVDFDQSSRKDYMIAVDLQKECAIQEFGFRFSKYFKGRNTKLGGVHGATNVLESLLLFWDRDLDSRGRTISWG